MPKGPFLSQTSGQMAIEKKNQQDIHAKTYNDRNSKPQQKRRLGTVSKNFTWGALIDFTWTQPSPLVLPWYTQDISSVRVKGF